MVEEHFPEVICLWLRFLFSFLAIYIVPFNIQSWGRDRVLQKRGVGYTNSFETSQSVSLISSMFRHPNLVFLLLKLFR